MGRHIFAGGFLAVALISSTFGPAVAYGKPTLALVHQGAIPLTVKEGKASASLSVTSENIDAQKMTLISVSMVSKATNRAVSLTDKEVRYQAPTAPTGLGWLLVEIPLSQLPENSRFGQYEMVIRAAADGQPVPPITLTFTYPESVLAQPDKVVLRIEDSILGRTVEPASVWLRVSDGPPPSAVTIGQAGSALRGNEAIGGQIVFGDVPALDNRTAIPVPVHEDDKSRFPLGESTGQALIVGPDSKPVSISFAVKVKAAPWYIFAFALLGISLGWLSRIQFVNWVGRKEALVGLEELRQKIERESALRKDAAFDQKIVPLAEELMEAADMIESVRPEAKKKFEEIRAKLDAAVAASETRRKELTSQVLALQAVVERSWVCPPDVENMLGVAKGGGVELIGLLGERKLDEVEARRMTLAARLKTDLSGWIGTWNDRIGYLGSFSAPLPVEVAPAVNAHVAALRSAKTEPANDSAEELLKGLEAIHNLSAHVRALRTLLLDAATNAIDDCRKELGNFQPTDIQALDAQSQLIEEERGVAPLTGPLAGLQRIAQLADDALKACATAIRNVAGTTNQVVDQYLQSGEYRRAARSAHESSTARSVRESTLGFGPGATAPVPPATLPQSSARAVPVIQVEAPGRVLISAPLTGYSPTELVRINIPRTRLEIAKAQRLRDLASAAVLAALAYPVFSPTFVGTISDILGVFAWGFTLDVGFGGLVQQLNDKFVKK